jgi:carbonic anhydrase/acetyltransferase-like protein (isoleucine patch superfamily)
MMMITRISYGAVPLYAFKGKSPRVHATAFVAPTAVLIGDVTLHEASSVWFGTVLRGDMDRIEIGARSNVQDNSTIHTDAGEPTLVGEDVTIGHNALVHSSVIEKNVLIGQASVLVGGCAIGTGSIVGAGAVVPAKMTVPPHSLVVGVPAKVVREARPEDERWTVKAAEHYVELAGWYRDNLDTAR